MPRKPKIPLNAYYFFMKEYREREEAKGVVFHNGLRDVSESAKDEWAIMPSAARKKYELKAREAKMMIRGTDEKYTSQGIPLSTIQKELEEQTKSLQREQDEVEKTLQDALMNDTLLEQQFHVMDINFYCQLFNDDYLTCEVAIATFSISQGVQSVYHTLIDVESIPIGYGRDASNKSAVLGVPMPPMEGGERDLVRVLALIVQALGGPLGTLAPIYALRTSIYPVRSFLTQLCDHANESTSKFRVFNLAQMFFHLRNALKEGSFPAWTLAEAVLDKDTFDQCKGLGCEMHEEGDLYSHCARSKAVRQAYMVCDYCCKVCDVTPIQGKHIPAKYDPQGSLRSPMSDDSFTQVSSSHKKAWRSNRSDRSENSPRRPETRKLQSPEWLQPGPSCSSFTMQTAAPPAEDLADPLAAVSLTEEIPAFEAAELWPAISEQKKKGTPSWGPPKLPRAPAPAPIISPQHLPQVSGRGVRYNAAPAITEDDFNWPAMGRGRGRGYKGGK